MGYIQDNTNTMQIYLTDLGRQRFIENGLKDSIAFFSLSDDSSNYDVLLPDPTEVLPYSSASLSTYNPGDVVATGTTYYRFKIGTGSRTAPPSGWWDSIITFNPTVITKQPIPTIDHVGTLKTSIGNNNAFNDDYLSDVFTQISLRGDIVDNNTYARNLKAVKSNTYKSYVFYQPDVSTTGTTTTYIIR